MLANNSLDQFSLLDELPFATPVWHPFVQHAEDAVQETKQETDERSHRA
ncbi:hypothetical protein AWB74_03972 [Caballeronia arvi]|uniref:Uncharacterized protein n=1 Tax=Caballeronia arvi TaxID=1777135 RepID=A0A158JK52_9BURK|nr:hypothetical protein AWB74_03972 [Caballeronia arvi]